MPLPITAVEGNGRHRRTPVDGQVVVAVSAEIIMVAAVTTKVAATTAVVAALTRIETVTNF